MKWPTTSSILSDSPNHPVGHFPAELVSKMMKKLVNKGFSYEKQHHWLGGGDDDDGAPYSSEMCACADSSHDSVPYIIVDNEREG